MFSHTRNTLEDTNNPSQERIPIILTVGRQGCREVKLSTGRKPGSLAVGHQQTRGGWQAGGHIQAGMQWGHKEAGKEASTCM